MTNFKTKQCEKDTTDGSILNVRFLSCYTENKSIMDKLLFGNSRWLLFFHIWHERNKIQFLNHNSNHRTKSLIRLSNNRRECFEKSSNRRVNECIIKFS